MVHRLLPHQSYRAARRQRGITRAIAASSRLASDASRASKRAAPPRHQRAPWHGYQQASASRHQRGIDIGHRRRHLCTYTPLLRTQFVPRTSASSSLPLAPPLFTSLGTIHHPLTLLDPPSQVGDGGPRGRCHAAHRAIAARASLRATLRARIRGTRCAFACCRAIINARAAPRAAALRARIMRSCSRAHAWLLTHHVIGAIAL